MRGAEEMVGTWMEPLELAVEDPEERRGGGFLPMGESAMVITSCGDLLRVLLVTSLGLCSVVVVVM